VSFITHGIGGERKTDKGSWVEGWRGAVGKQVGAGKSTPHRRPKKRASSRRRRSGRLWGKTLPQTNHALHNKEAIRHGARGREKNKKGRERKRERAQQ